MSFSLTNFSALTGFLPFLLAKFFGYIAMAIYLNKFYKKDCSKFRVALSRIILGLVGYQIFSLLLSSALPLFGLGAIRGFPAPPEIFFSGLFILRMIEWWLVITFFYQRKGIFSKEKQFNCLKGALLSHVLDIPAFFGSLFLIGGLC